MISGIYFVDWQIPKKKYPDTIFFLDILLGLLLNRV